MPNLNRVMLIGHLGRTAELRYTPGGSAVANFSLAVSEKWKDKSGQQQEKTEWFNVSYFGKGAEAVAEWLTKGKAVLVEGSIGTREYEKDGQKRTSVDVKAQHVTLLGGKSDAEKPAAADAGVAENDIPF